jgi:hypothetical protein
MRTIWVALSLALMMFGLASGASAQNGLQKFESDIKPQIELKTFTYGSASALGSDGFVLNNVVVVVPGNPGTGGQETTVKIDKVTVDQLDFERLKKSAKEDEAPRFAKIKLEGMTGDDTLSAMLAPYGVPKVPVDITLDYNIDTATKVLTLSKLEVNLRGQARISLAMVLDGISDKPSQMQNSQDDGKLRTASLDIDDTGLLAKVLPAIAKEQGTTAEAMVAMAVVPIGAFAQGQGPATVKALDAIVSFISDWKQPKGPIKITIKPAKTAGMADLDKIMEPNALTDLFGLAVDYAGMRPGAAGGGAGGGATATAPSASKVLEGGEAGLSLAGNTLTGKIDGEVFFEFYKKDGNVALMEGSEISTGKWTIEGNRLCTKYKGDDKDCYGIKRDGETVTLTEKGGKAYRLKLLEGNPKNL